MTTKRFTRLLTRSESDPSIVLDDRRCLKPRFCEAFFELCDGKSLEQPPAAIEYAEHAVRLAEKIGDPHLIHRARGVMVHAYIANERWSEAEDLLEDYRAAARRCCSTCLGDWLRRQGDLLVEARQVWRAKETLERSLAEHGSELDPDQRGRVRFLRGIAHHFDNDPDRALEDAGEALQELALTTPHGYFLDSIALIACFLEGDVGRRHDERALRFLEQFKLRLKGRRGWSAVRVRLAWVEGLLYARLGDTRRALDRLERVRTALSEDGPARHLVAVSADLAQLYARQINDVNERAIRRIVDRCRRAPDLEDELRSGLESVAAVLRSAPSRTFDALVELRRSFTVPVPGLLAEALTDVRA